MGARGPRPLPDNVHLLNGNPSKKRLAVLVGGARVPVEIPDMPRNIFADARKEWKRITRELEKLGLIAKIDRVAIAMYCQSYEDWVVASLQINKMGNEGLVYTTSTGYQQLSPWYLLRKSARDDMLKVLVEFGMTPSARSRVQVTLQQDLFGDDNSLQTTQNPADSYFRPR